MLLGFDLDTGQISGDFKTNPEALVLGEPDEDGDFYANLGAGKLKSGQDYAITCYFRVTDIRGDTFLSEPLNYIIVNDLNEMTVDPIPGQPYTGKAIMPKVRMTFLEADDVLTEGVHYKVEYTNNIKRGQATIKITSLDEELQGTLTLHFNIV